MEYRYNNEMDRILRYAWNPFFFQATYRNKNGEERSQKLWACSSHRGTQLATAESFCKSEDEHVTSLSLIRAEEFARWFAGGDTVEYEDGMSVPAYYAVQFAISLDQPGPNPEDRDVLHGSLDEFRTQLANNGAFKTALHDSFALSRPERDVVRVAEDPVIWKEPGEER